MTKKKKDAATHERSELAKQSGLDFTNKKEK
jgi:hypothetical protein